MTNSKNYLYSQRKNIEEMFINFFTRNGYLLTPPVNLITADETLLFTNDTITPWKHYVKNENLPDFGVCMQQRCVRLQGLKDTLVEENKYERKFERFIGYFNSLGILSAPSQKDAVQNLVIDLLTKEYQISSEEIKIFGSSNMNFLGVLEQKLLVERDTRPQKYYQWKYGIPDVSGFGATIGLLQNNGEFLEIGQLIELTKRNNCVGYEFGFGSETFLARKHKSETYDAWTITHCVPEALRFKTLLDIYSCFAAICTIPEELFTLQHIAMRTRLARAVAKIEDIFDINQDITRTGLNKFVDIEFKMNSDEKIALELSKARNRQILLNDNFDSSD